MLQWRKRNQVIVTAKLLLMVLLVQHGVVSQIHVQPALLLSRDSAVNAILIGQTTDTTDGTTCTDSTGSGQCDPPNQTLD